MTLKLHDRTALASTLEVRADALPAGVCGRVTGIALRYNVVDSYGTRFKPGSLDSSRAKINAGRVKLFDNHEYGTRSHIGVVRTLTTAGDAEVMTADLFDTEDGRRAKEYLSAVMASGGETGLSVGFFAKAGAPSDGAYDFTDIDLDEISLAPRQAVPGATVAGVRRDVGALKSVLDGLRSVYGADALLALLREQDESATAGDEPAVENDPTPTYATLDERAAAVRQTITVPTR
jgi:hypothetical protein